MLDDPEDVLDWVDPPVGGGVGGGIGEAGGVVVVFVVAFVVGGGVEGGDGDGDGGGIGGGGGGGVGTGKSLITHNIFSVCSSSLTTVTSSLHPNRWPLLTFSIVYILSLTFVIIH